MGRESDSAIVTTANGKTGTTAATALAPGFRFHPTDEELVSYYLKRKILAKPVRFNAIGEVDIYKHEPWNLAEFSRLRTRDQEWYFFSMLDKKYVNGARMNRATGQGYWKATGKDREVRRDSQLLGMKKTLVFHSGRAPDGQRTNWVMHEYRLIDEELDKIVGLQGYVLCRVFHKNNIGPPNGNRYAPFMEEEWDDASAALIPGIDGGDDTRAGNDGLAATNVTESNGIERNDVEQEIQVVEKTRSLQDINSTENNPLTTNECPGESRDKLLVCKIERSDDCPPVCVLNKEAPLPLLQYKRRRHNDSGSNHASGSEQSTRTTQDQSSTTTTAAAVAATEASSATTAAISALLEFSLMESIEPKENPHFPPPTYDAANLESPVPPSCMNLINELQNEIHKISVERETMKLEMLSAQAMINILQSRIDFLSKENEDLKREIQNRNQNPEQV
ncbi:hypothetical protein SLEP1_g42609 [Rubroshorea leprosula]|uniref:NAC domain-containing protein n=2 Tax=Rubroshorea leprosula TaxID=152421 RepID=A0AAV5LAG3_9ROSI|nr:hypothetical protein SLEP1_g42609 [Rubroshorea leprosula]